MAFTWLRKRASSRRARAAGRPIRPVLEPLEERALLSTFTVVDLGDAGVGSGLQGDLRYCVDTADTNGDLSNHIVFENGLAGTIHLQRGRLFVDKNLGIDGPGAGLLTVSAGGLSGVFEVTTDPRAQDFRLSGVTVADGTGVFTTLGHEGGGLFNWHANVTLTNCVFTGNVVGGPFDSGRGGGIYSVAGDVALTNCTLTDNHAQGPDPANGGGIYLAAGTLALNHCTVTGNSAVRSGGGLYNLAGVLTATDSVVSDNAASLAGGIDDLNVMTLANCTITNNVTSGSAGGIEALGFDTLTDCTIADNTTGGVGGGFENSGISQLTLDRCTVSGNSAGSAGGAVWWAGGLVTATNCTFSGNSAGDGAGGAILMLNAVQLGSLELTSCTLGQNSAADGGGLAIGNTSIVVLMRNTIVAANQASGGAPDVQGNVLSLGHNLIGAVDGSAGWQGTDLTGTGDNPLDPRLGPLQDNGGPTQTQAPFADSPAIDNGDPVLYRSVDQRGTYRNFDGLLAQPDIGAVEGRTAVALRLVVPAQVTAAQPFALTVVALDEWGNAATIYGGTVHFESTDLGAVLPGDYTFAVGDQGRQTFAVTLNTPGLQTIRVTDTHNGGISQTASTLVESSLAATAAEESLWGLAGLKLDDTGWHPRRV